MEKIFTEICSQITVAFLTFWE